MRGTNGMERVNREARALHVRQDTANDDFLQPLVVLLGNILKTRLLDMGWVSLCELPAWPSDLRCGTLSLLLRSPRLCCHACGHACLCYAYLCRQAIWDFAQSTLALLRHRRTLASDGSVGL